MGDVHCARRRGRELDRRRGVLARTLAAIDDTRLRWLAVVAWPFATSRIQGAAAEHAARVNKALVAFIACLMIAAAAWSAAANLHRFAR